MAMIGAKPTLDGILKGYQKTVGQLEQLIKMNESEARAKEQQIVRLEQEKANLEIETSKAAKIKENITTIIGE